MRRSTTTTISTGSYIRNHPYWKNSSTNIYNNNNTNHVINNNNNNNKILLQQQQQYRRCITIVLSSRMITTKTTTTATSRLYTTTWWNTQKRLLSQHHQQQQQHYPMDVGNDQNNDGTIYSNNNNPIHTIMKKKKIVIVGSGPSGCYTAKYLIKAFDALQKSNTVITTTTTTTSDSDSNNSSSSNSSNNSSNNNNNYHHHGVYPVVLQQIDIIDKLPTPYGLVRYGVAPDHPEVKNVQNDFDTLFDTVSSVSSNDTATTTTTMISNNNYIIPKVNFLGNVHVGIDISISELRTLYDIVILCYGCDSDRKLPIQTTTKTTTTTRSSLQSIETDQLQQQQQDYKNVISAREFVAWYNGHPYYEHIGTQVRTILQQQMQNTNPLIVSNQEQQYELQQQLQKQPHVVIVGHGNVALDCARIFAKGGTIPNVVSSTLPSNIDGGLYDTDISSDALHVLKDFPTSNISVIGRRGHIQASFTIKEVRELVNLQKNGFDTALLVRMHELDLCTSTNATQQEMNGPNGRPKIRIDTLLRETALQVENNVCTRKVHLRFLLNPIHFEADEFDPTLIRRVVCERNMLSGEAGQQRPVGTGEVETIPTCLILVSIGYKGIPLPGTEQWFDNDTGIICNDHGRVDGSTAQLGGLYTSGWIKRGPNGIIGTNIADAKETVATIMADITTCTNTTTAPTNKNKIDGMDNLYDLLKQRGVKVVDWEGYRRIELKELSIRTNVRQPRAKLLKLKEQLEAAV